MKFGTTPAQKPMCRRNAPPAAGLFSRTAGGSWAILSRLVLEPVAGALRAHNMS